MSSIGAWLGTGSALIVIGLCYLLMKYGHNLPAMTHPWQHRLVIALMFCAGATLLITPVGGWVLRELNSLAGLFGGITPGSGAMWALVTVGALLLFAGVVVALIWAPDPAVGYAAAATPLVLALAPGGVAHEIYAATVAPAQALVEQVAHWAGG